MGEVERRREEEKKGSRHANTYGRYKQIKAEKKRNRKKKAKNNDILIVS